MPKPSPNVCQANLLRIHDLETVSGLLLSGFQPSGHEWAGERLYFCFPDSPDARAVLSQLAAGELKADPGSVIQAFRAARRMLAEAKRAAGRFR